MSGAPTPDLVRVLSADGSRYYDLDPRLLRGHVPTCTDVGGCDDVRCLACNPDEAAWPGGAPPVVGFTMPVVPHCKFDSSDIEAVLHKSTLYLRTPWKRPANGSRTQAVALWIAHDIVRLQFGSSPCDGLSDLETLVWTMDLDWSKVDARGDALAPEPLRFSWLLQGVVEGTGAALAELLDKSVPMSSE